MVIGFAVILFCSKRTTINYLILTLFLFAVIISGSRSAVIGLFLALISYLLYNKSQKKLNIFLIIGSLLLFSFLSSEYNAISRVLESDLLNNRKYEYIYAVETFLQKPLFGHGLKNYAYIFSIIFFSILFFYLIKIYKQKTDVYGKNILQTKFLFFLITYALVNGFFENTIIGINFFQTNLFWLTFAYFLNVLYQKNESCSISD